MTILVGIAADDLEQGAVTLAVDLARASGEELRVVTVIGRHAAAAGSPGEAEYRRYFASQAEHVLAAARQHIPDDVAATYATVANRSTSAGLFAEAKAVGARLFVLGSARDGLYGRVCTGSVTDRMLHSSPLPVAIAPRGLRTQSEGPADAIPRLSVAYAGKRDDALLGEAAAEAGTLHAGLRVLTLAVRSSLPMYSAGAMGEDTIVGTWLDQVGEEARAGLSALGVEGEVEGVRGPTWSDALSFVRWERGELLVLGSSRGVFERVFIGSRAAKILRHCPVPALIMPTHRKKRQKK
ncbi:universal stress protein [Brevibacterium sp. BRM-1]|uniref:universal stress protein n=1 Tax=Brevibacterium sp. BRM-1 TaxID=2999062 RepID=UPI00227E07F0|nr:universal stress protein [Brevibacterium sp. BRM-1]WAL40009.1 universal stress protein [Brevibacterium sp. BRM-1]